MSVSAHPLDLTAAELLALLAGRKISAAEVMAATL
jgi:hypothetical protein